MKTNKPNPKKLIPLVEKLSCKNPLYIGDSEDDSQLVLNYKKHDYLYFVANPNKPGYH